MAAEILLVWSTERRIFVQALPSQNILKPEENEWQEKREGDPFPSMRRARGAEEDGASLPVGAR
jgi:hypothetical protein